jgi:hypothetical protein
LTPLSKKRVTRKKMIEIKEKDEEGKRAENFERMIKYYI